MSLRWIKSHPVIALCALATGLMLPFIQRAAHIDDGLFLMLAQRIGWNPLTSTVEDFPYLGQVLASYVVFEASHPPLIPYYLKWVGLVNPGDAMWIYHLAFLPFVWLTVGGFFFMRVPSSGRMGMTSGPRSLRSS